MHSMHFGGCFGEFADKAAIVWYVKLIPQPHTTMRNRQTPEVAMHGGSLPLRIYCVCNNHRYVPCIISSYGATRV